MRSWFRSLSIVAVAVAVCLACTGAKGDKGDTGDPGQQGPPGVAAATPPLMLSGANNATISLARPMRSTGGGNLLDWRSDVT